MNMSEGVPTGFRASPEVLSIFTNVLSTETSAVHFAPLRPILPVITESIDGSSRADRRNVLEHDLERATVEVDAVDRDRAVRRDVALAELAGGVDLDVLVRDHDVDVRPTQRTDGRRDRDARRADVQLAGDLRRPGIEALDVEVRVQRAGRGADRIGREREHRR